MEYHSDGSDPFYNSDANGRKNYYVGFTGYPTAYFDGRRQVEVGGYNGTFNAYLNKYNLEMAYNSLCTLNVFVDYNADTRFLKVNARVTKLNAFSGAYLRYAIAENLIYYHWPYPPPDPPPAFYLDSLHHVVRKMLPNYSGVVIPDTLSIGHSFVNSQTYTLNPAWDEKNCYVVVFVQSNTATLQPVYRSVKSGLFTEVNWVFGDASGDGLVNSADIVYLINYLFVGGPPPNPPASGDPTNDCNTNSADIVYLINYLYVGGPAPLKGCAF